MRRLLYIIVFIVIAGCASKKNVYWCGDHPCINKKEKEAYFKKTMIVEIKSIDAKSSKSNSEIEKIIQQAKVDEKKRIKKEKNLEKEIKLEEKAKIKEEKRLAKQTRLEEKRRIKEEKILEKQVRLEEKKRTKEKKKITKLKKNKKKEKVKNETVEFKQVEIVDAELDIGKSINALTNFKQLAEKIIKKNTLRPYPDINDIPN